MILELITFIVGASAGAVGSHFIKLNSIKAFVESEIEKVRSEVTSLEDKLKSKEDEVEADLGTEDKTDSVATPETVPSEPVAPVTSTPASN